LEKLPEVSELVKEGDKFRFFTRDPPTVLDSLWKYSQDNNLKLITVNTVGPSLEDVFVKLTGIRPATAEEESGKSGRSEEQGIVHRRRKQ
jgi:ABC-2 type transport system ATP-binding protein